MKIGYAPLRDDKMSVGWYYAFVCCPFCVRPDRWGGRGGHTKNHKSKTLRTHRLGTSGRNHRRASTRTGIKIGVGG